LIHLFDGVFITLMIVMSQTFLYHDFKEIYSYFVSILFLPIILHVWRYLHLKLAKK